MIKEIIMKNVKGTTTNQQLTGKDIIIGPNGVGKSTRIQVLGAALLGYVPGHGKAPGETFKHSSDQDVMTVGLSVNDFTFERNFERNVTRNKTTGKEDIKYSEKVSLSPSKGERTNTQKKSRIEQEVGSFPVMLDFNEFLGLSDSKRRDFIYGLSSAGSTWTKEKLDRHLNDSLLSMEIEVNNPDYYETLTESINEAINNFPNNYDFSDGLTAVIDWVDGQLSYYKKQKDDSEGAVRAFAEMKNKLNDTDRGLKQNKEELTQLRNKLMAVKEQYARDFEKKKAFDRKNERITELQQSIESLKNNQIEGTEQIEKQITELNQQVKEVPESKSASYEAKATELENQKQQNMNEAWTAKGKTQELAAKKASIEQTLNTINENKGVCVIQAQIACNKDFSKYLEHAQAKVDSLAASIKEFIEIGNEKIKLAENLGKLVKEWRQKAQQDNNNFREVVNHNQQITNKISLLKEQLNLIQKKKEQQASKLQDLNSELEKLQNESNEPIAPLDILERQQEALAKQIEELETKVTEQEKAKNQLATLKQSMLNYKKAEMKVNAFNSIKKELGAKGVQGLIVKEQLDPIKKDIEENLRAMGVEHEVFFQTTSDTGQEVFQFGWVNTGEQRNFDSLSTGQQIIFLIGFMITILERANPPLKVLAIDNIENLDPKNFYNVVKGLDQLSHKVDNIILAGVLSPISFDGWKVWQLEQTNEAGEMHESAS
ncbi:ATP-binding protein [Schinkia azotoformans]|uniref:Nuclease SbcCD subunit C n=1 Tax=Schinkia azotoformans LMG 9581 TaxID=1131731 RepID=K6DIA0_SCHAZ|nr:ATP-binding protein [Schinkia azotoformans]EKN67848.1 hypothetical protein BAZO_08199 [Schinkia azotoformans LMG 9581]MEC1637386.1 ATP-binding protein [Schinkia azotoformans]MEC1943790.1 ATP-binding protein [Schinkia azotoformans]